MASEQKKPAEHRPQRDTRNPCAVCGWSKHMAIHTIIEEGPRKGRPYGHAYVPQQSTNGGGNG